MTELPQITRRTVLFSTLAAGAGVGLAACGTGSSSLGANQGSGAGNTAGAASAPSVAGGGGSGQALVKLSAVPVGGAVVVDAAGTPVVVAQPTAGEVVGFSARCTHQGCVVNPQGGQLVCPCHGSVFDAKTGKNLQGPAPTPLPAISVKLSGGEVVTA